MMENGDRNEQNLPAPRSEILMYQTEDGRTRFEVQLEDGTVWLSQRLLAELYQKDVRTINEHIKNILNEEELDASSTIRKFRIVREEGGRQVARDVDFYNLPMILAVGYRVRSHRGTQFRRWATILLNEYVVKGFAMDDDRLKDGRTSLGADYFDELLERIRDIRASERRFYLKICDIYATAVDYDGAASAAQEFFATVQNKLHWAIHGRTAAELITDRADADKPNMGLTSWKGDRVRKQDTTIAKNYLDETELSDLNRIVTMYLDYAEDQATRHQPMIMAAWAEKLDGFLQFNEREVLGNAGRVSAEVAKALAHEVYERFRLRRVEEADAAGDGEFERMVKRIEGEGDGDLQ